MTKNGLALKYPELVSGIGRNVIDRISNDTVWVLDRFKSQIFKEFLELSSGIHISGISLGELEGYFKAGYEPIFSIGKLNHCLVLLEQDPVFFVRFVNIVEDWNESLIY